MAKISALHVDLDDMGLSDLFDYFTAYELKRLIEDGAARAERERINIKAKRDFENQLRCIADY